MMMRPFFYRSLQFSARMGAVLICVAAQSYAQGQTADKVPPAPEPIASPASPNPVTAVPATPNPNALPNPNAAPGPNAPGAPTGTLPEKAIPQNPPARKPGPESADSPASKEASKDTPKDKARAAYVIGSLDVLYVKVWNNTNLTGLVDVRPDGMISLPLIGEVKADGSTVEELRKTLTAKLSEFLTEPEIDIQVTKINSKKYLILGEGANRPGTFPLTEPITVMEALTSAGGFRDFANPRKIYIMRGSQRFNFNYKDVSKGKHLEEDIQIQNGDRIFIP